MRGCIEAMKAAVADTVFDPELRFEAERRLYLTIAEASGNEHFVLFTAMIDGKISENLRSVAVKNAKAAEWGETVVAEHQCIVNAIERRDQATAREETRLHYEKAAQRLADRADFVEV